jgi:hypothetical protein
MRYPLSGRAPEADTLDVKRALSQRRACLSIAMRPSSRLYLRDLSGSNALVINRFSER